MYWLFRMSWEETPLGAVALEVNEGEVPGGVPFEAHQGSVCNSSQMLA